MKFMEWRDYSSRVTHLQSLTLKVHELSQAVAHVNHKELQLVCVPFAAQMEEFNKKPGSMSSDSLRFIAFVLDYFSKVFSRDSEVVDHGKDRPFNVLIVDDEPLTLRTTGMALKNSGFNISSEQDSRSALALTASDDWDVIIMDVEMPEINGYQLCQKIRLSNSNPDTPIVFVTGNSGKEMREKCKEIGGNDIVTKPFSFSELSAKCWVWVFLSIRNSAAVAS